MSKTSFQFHGLTPRIVDKESSLYKITKKALDEAYTDNDIKNIAITGVYGSGKSSFLKTYFSDKTNQKSIINVSIADFENENNESNKIKIAEHQVINQILYQIPSYKIPLSKFRLKDRRRWWEVLLFVIVLSFFAIGVFSLFNQSLLDFIISDLIKTENARYYANLSIIFFLLVPLLSASVWLSRRVLFKISKFNFKGTESELIEEDNAQLLDQESREIVYLILASDIDTIIFEDLDRFKDISIFIRLREINSLVNYRSDKIVRFIYVIKDDLFKSKDRTKFFDILIPIIPEVTSHNSRGKVLELFSDIEEEHLKISRNVLEKISVFIDDMRLLYSIRNEYEIYSRGLETDVYSDELFALLVLKNVFPKEFAELESDRGYLYRILNKREELVKEYQEVLREKIKEKEDIRNQVVSNYSDFLASNIPTGRVRIRTNESIGQFMYNWSRNKDSYKQIYFDNINNSYTFSTFIDKLCDIEPNLKERLEQIDYGDLDQRIESLNEEIIDLERDISKRQTSKTSELLLELGEDSLREYFEEENDEFKEIIENHYFPLIKVLMLSGLIDENYWRYKSYFHEGYLGPNDNVFINRVLTGKAIKNSFKLDNPSTVISYFEDIDYQRKDIVNYDLIDELIYQQKENPLIYILKNIKDNDDKEAINYINLFEYDKLKNVMEIILSHGFTDFFEFFSTVDLPKELKLKLTGLACENQDLEPNSDFIDYVSRNSEILELDYIKRKDLMLKTLVKSGIKFKDIKNLNVQSDIYKFIADNKMFIMNLDNLIKLSNELLVEGNRSEQDSLIRLFYLLSKNTNETLKEYTEENLEDIISQFLDRIEKQKIKSNSGEKGFLNILNSDLSNEIKVRLIKSEISNISDLKDVQSIELWVELFKCDLIKPTQENLMIYFNKTNEVYSIIDYLNKNYKVEFDLTQEMYRQIINSNKTDFKLFNLIKDKITELLDAIDPEIGIEKLKLLISSNLIECNIKNLIHIINTNNNPIILDFIKMSHNIDKLVVSKKLCKLDCKIVFYTNQFI